ncbi:unnamed protein product [Brassicogethes aeneus]|uniref:chitinase n=1 Tax=Brassicogethes aeneus TaxID=1431903 RepID=A0A9P0FFC1_BRAAE|nr:unnamed protein product [Brassicogethes aeneus]
MESAYIDKVVCYYGSWSTYRPGNGKFTTNDIDANLCTHLIYSFVGINTDGSIKILDTGLEEGQGNLAKTTALKKVNPKLKTLVAIGGWSEGSVKYSAVVASPNLRANFIKSALALVKKYGFDGFDLDWEYPAQRGGVAADKANYVQLLKEFRAVWDKEGLILTAAVAASGSSVDISYDVPALSKYLDLINVMTYDLHGSWDGVTGQNAPLYASSKDVSSAQKQLNVDACIRGWIQRGAAPEKLVLGMGVYGRTFTLTSTSNTGLGAPIVSTGKQGPYTQERGMLGYNEICELEKQGGWTEVWDNEQKVPYAFKGDQWIGYDNPKSIAIKVNYSKNLKLGGVMIWSIETDDFKGICGKKYPILNAIKTALEGSDKERNDNQPSDTDKKPEPTPTKPESEKESDSESDSHKKDSDKDESSSSLECKQVGYIRDLENCSIFYWCMKTKAGFEKFKHICPAGLMFDTKNNICNVVCYFASWTIYRPGNGKFQVSNIDPSLCTHICYGFFGLGWDLDVQILDDWELNGLHELSNMMALKNSNPDLKILASMGGWNEGSEKYSDMASDPAKRKTLVQKTVSFLKNNSFDGFDLDWEYPAQRGGNVENDPKNFVILLQELKTALNNEGLILSIAAPGAKHSIDLSIIVPEVSNAVDMLNIMTYDFHGKFDSYVGHVAPLYASSLDNTDELKQLNVAAGIQYWIDLGADVSKMNIGFPTYGQSFTLTDATNTSLYASIIGGGRAGPYTRSEGILGYNEICELYNDWQYIWDEEQQVPHLISDNQWVGYESPESAVIKTKFAKSKNLGGVMFWSLDTDDFLGVCGKGTYPIIRAVVDEFNKNYIE